ncbi:NAD(P)H-hydrate dehydratase [Candidatus Curtissbacteria bacterium RIFCSPHIGHO2_01_FULL_41_11]|uniref:ADP-dependent (S)-NAD(P)H-hydrate dehydratase n=1 Tax=Candidatus Curtissbacteria bacterium RIFCSPHIGHO2_01_FULL_41_11 TaxID=1797711 RepID=A0A1F5G345_9BACT|nr:MAG: NAD(P)H-hydrate dehydratase [Candidatus Curtissbacteria bacterium RIFCSPHIGHO2_01_FULL_41_11]
MDLSRIYHTRPAWSHKGNFGNVLVICGSKLYSGAATLAAGAALRAGADLVSVCAPERAANVAGQTFADLMTYPLKGDYLVKGHINDIVDVAHVRNINAVCMGCGLGRHGATSEAIHKIISKINVPMVLDADALRAISAKPQSVWGKQLILTPHAGELAILLSQSKIPDDFDARLVAAKQAAHKYHAVVLLKGHVDIITDGTSTITNNSGTPLMTKGGFGDTLSGICVALLARGVGLFEAAHAAAFINGKAGELAAHHMGEGVIASDIFDYIPKAINST